MENEVKMKNAIYNSTQNIIILKDKLKTTLCKIYLCTEDYKVLLEEDRSKWRDTPCRWIGRFNIVTITILPKFTCRFNASLVKIP